MMKKWIKKLLRRFGYKSKTIEIINVKYHDGHFPIGTLKEYP